MSDVRGQRSEVRQAAHHDAVIPHPTSDDRRPVYERFATRNVGTVLPPPAVTLSSTAVDSRVKSPSMYAPLVTNGAVSYCRSTNSTRPSTQLGYDSLGTSTRSCTMCGDARAAVTAASHVGLSTVQPSVMPLPP